MNQNLTPLEEMTVIAVFRLCSDLGINQAKEIFESRYSKSTTKRAWKLCEQIFENYQDYDYSEIKTKVQNSFEDFATLKSRQLTLLTSIDNAYQLFLV